MKKFSKAHIALAISFILVFSTFLLTTDEFLSTLKGRGYVKLYELVGYDSNSIELLQLKADAYGKPLVPPFVDFERGYVVAPKYDLSICKVKKSMSTLMNGIACVLFDTEEFMRQNRSILEMWEFRMCADRNEYYWMNDTEKVLNKTSTKLAVVRNPISRFISFFVDKCIFETQLLPMNAGMCYKCRGDVECYLKVQYERFMTHAKYPSVVNISYEDTHAAPLSWNCEFNQYMENYTIVKMDAEPNLRKKGLYELIQILEKKHVPERTLEFIMKSALGSETEHSTFRSDARINVTKQIQSNPVIQDYLRRIYLLDFIIFGFDYSILSF